MSSEKKYAQHKMVNWYDAKQLASTGLKAVISGEFGHYADKRELQAALSSSDDSFSFGNNSEFWIDYVSDTGDGFNSTYSVARLVSEQNLKLALKPDYESSTQDDASEYYKNGVVTQPGNIIVFGGDQVYPTPEMSEYETRFKTPFRAANPDKDTIEENDRPKMFAIPGNHDWYDGLSNFIKLFCQNRRIGNWQTMQKRSYFAIELPYNYWLFGTDVQLNSDIDQPQKEYFQNIAKNKMKDGDKVILCTAEPAWVYHQMYDDNESYKRLKYFEKLYITDDAYNLIGKKFKLVATLTGDLHHYSHYDEEKDGYINHLITAGGGGAFLHPTHLLPDKLTKLDDVEFSFQKTKMKNEPELKGVFPAKNVSRKLSWKNFAFPLLSKQFVFFLSTLQLLLTWVLQGTTYYDNNGTFIEQLAVKENMSASVSLIFTTLIHNPLFILISAILIFGCMSFTDVKRIKYLNWWLGLPHGIIQWINLLLWIYLFSKIFHNVFGDTHQMRLIISTTIVAAVCSGIFGAFIFGVYLWFSIYVLKVHLDEAFSSLAYQHYKNFLRIHITKDQVTIYPVGIDKVTTDWKQSGDGENLKFEGALPQCHLIETPIIIKNN
ncbi:MAG: metallophosphoesterase [Bacteroidia bacterium]